MKTRMEFPESSDQSPQCIQTQEGTFLFGVGLTYFSFNLDLV